MLLDIQNVNFRYRHDASDVLKDFSLSIAPGTMVLLVGPTGCGKTTAVLTMNGLVPASTGGTLTGEIAVDGMSTKNHFTPQLASKVGVVFQDPEGQMCALFLEDEIAFGLENLKYDVETILRRVDEMLAFIDLQGMSDKSVYELSGGQKQKVNFASVLAMRPSLLVADMPTANLDPIGSQEVLRVLRDLVSGGETTCLIIENRVDELADLADRVVVMSEGQIQIDGHPHVVFGDHGRKLRDEIGIDIPQVVSLALDLREAGCDIGIPLTVAEAADALYGAYRDGRIEIVSNPEARPQPAPAGSPLIETKDVTYTYADGTNALKGVSFQMSRGEVFAIIGNNGSGKTTLAKHLVGLLRPSSGSISVAGMNTSTTDVRDIAKRVTYVFQYPDQQFVTQKVYDELAFNLHQADYPDDEVDRRVEEMLARFQLTSFKEKSPFLLSGGEMRSLSVACMLTLDPEIVILDEPTYGQDLAHVTALMRILEEQLEKGMSIILITHDMRLVAEYANHVLVMSEGRPIFDGAPEDLFHRSSVLEQAALKAPPISALASTLREAGVSLPEGIITIESFMKSVRIIDQPLHRG
jgi:energy-coupling factor transporter ATP-binding protein EcfA2